MNAIRIGDTELKFADKGTGAVLLLVHGFPLDHTQWVYQIDEFAKHFRVLAPDLPGFGQSELGSKTISMRQMADDLASLLDELQIDTATYCGLSMGGYIGWQFWKYHSDRLERMIACDTRAAADTETVARGRRIYAQSVREDGSSRIADEMIPKLFHEASLQERAADVDAIGQVISASNPETLAQVQLAMAERPDATSWLENIRVPVLFIVGKHDRITPPVEMRENADRVRDAQFIEIGNSGHLPPLENPDEFNQAVLEFLGV